MMASCFPKQRSTGNAPRRERYGRSEREFTVVRALVGWLQAAGLPQVTVRTRMIERTDLPKKSSEQLQDVANCQEHYTNFKAAAIPSVLSKIYDALLWRRTSCPTY